MENTVHSFLPVWACLASLAAVPLILIFRKETLLRESVTILAGIAKFGFVLAMVPIILGGKTISITLIDGIAGSVVPIAFRVDGLGLLFAIVASVLWIPTSIYAIGYMRTLKEHSQTRFYVFFAVSLFATLGVAFSGNLLTLYLFYEILSLATWPLVAHHQDDEAKRGGRSYIAHLLGSSIAFVIPAMLYAYSKSGGTLDFGAQAILADADIGYVPGLALLLAFCFGFSKAALMPLHSWLPGAMVAPTPVSALLHAVAVVKVGVFCVIRTVLDVFGVELLSSLGIHIVLCWIAAFTLVTASLIALTQDNLKRRLAFSTISQLSYIVLGIALLSEKAALGSILHIAMHAFGKITLFFCAGAIFVAAGKKCVSELDGLGRRMPVTFIAFTIGAMSVTGLPPTGGFLSKLYLVWGAADAHQIALLCAFLISTVLNGAYFFPIVYRAFFLPAPTLVNGGTGESGAGAAGAAAAISTKIAEAPLLCVLPLAFTALGSLFLFFFPGTFFDLANLAIHGGIANP